MKIFYYFTLSIIITFSSGCSDNFISQINDNSILRKDIKCLNLVVFPPKKSISKSLNSLYPFKKKCKLTLVVSYKTGIVCNSNQNSDKKVKGLPDGYLRLEIKNGTRLYYSYYKDLDHTLNNRDIEKGFTTLKSTLGIH